MNSDAKPLVTITIPTYNQEDYVETAIRSALNQTYSNLEVVVSDDCSTDGTWERIQRFDEPRLHTHQQDSNVGKSANYRSLLYELARGELVLNLDGDDELIHERYVEAAVDEFFTSGGGIVFVTAERLIRTRQETLHLAKPLDRIQSGKEVFKQHYRGHFSITHMTCLYRRDLAQNLKFYHQEIPSEDRLGLLKLALHGTVGFVSETVGVRNVRQQSLSNNLSPEEIKRNARSVTEPIQYGLQNKFLEQKEAESLLKLRLRKHYFDKVLTKIRKRSWSEAIQVVRDGIDDGALSWIYPFLKVRFYLSFCPPLYRICQNIYLACRHWYRTSFR